MSYVLMFCGKRYARAVSSARKLLNVILISYQFLSFTEITIKVLHLDNYSCWSIGKRNKCACAPPGLSEVAKNFGKLMYYSHFFETPYIWESLTSAVRIDSRLLLWCILLSQSCKHRRPTHVHWMPKEDTVALMRQNPPLTAPPSCGIKINCGRD